MKEKSPITAMLLIVCMMLTASTSALAGHTWSSYHWARDQNPVTIGLGNNLSAKWQPFLATTSNDWSQSDVVNTPVTGGQAKGRCRVDNGRAEVCNDFYGATGWLGVAQIWVSEGHIVKGAVKVNDSYFETSKYDTIPWRNLVMCQEVGHILGLGHNDEDFSTTNGTCMDYSVDPLPNQHPNQHDYVTLAEIYTHLDVSSGGGGGGGDDGGGGGGPCKGGPKRCGGNLPPPAMGELDWNDHRNWGQVVAASKNKRYAVFVRTFEGGHKVITYVILV
jgi:hypothetical protein